MRKKVPAAKRPVEFQYVTLSVSRAGQEIVPCALDDPRANTYYANSQGQKCAAYRPISNCFAVGVRHASRMAGACHALLHTETWDQPLGEAPRIPENALFIAKAFELAESN